MSSVSLTNESCFTYEMSPVSHTNESCFTYEWVLFHLRMSRVSIMNESCDARESYHIITRTEIVSEFADLHIPALHVQAYLPHTIKFIPETDMFFLCWHSQSFHLHSGGGSCFTTQAMTTQAMSWRGLIDGERPLNGFENGWHLADNRIEYVLLTNWDGHFICFSANRTLPGSQMLPSNGITKWNFVKKKEKAYQNREYIWLCGGGYFHHRHCSVFMYFSLIAARFGRTTN